MVRKYSELYLDARRQLLPTEGEQAGKVARMLLSAASGKTEEAIIADRDLYASEEISIRTDALVRRYLSGEPLAYLFGEWDFYGMTLTVTPDVLIPRDDTAAVTELAIKRALFLPQNARILDTSARIRELAAKKAVVDEERAVAEAHRAAEDRKRSDARS